MFVYSVNKDDVLLMVLAVFLAPVSVWKRKGFFSRDLLLNVLLYFLFFLPAVLHAVYVIYETSDERSCGYQNILNQEDGSEPVSQQPRNGDFNVDLEAQGSLPRYDDIVVNSSIAQSAIGDNKIQHQ